MGLDVRSSPRDPPNEVQKERGMLCLQGCQLREFLCNFEGKRGQTHFAEALDLLTQECSG